MDLNAIGFNYSWLDASMQVEARRRGVKKSKSEAEAEQRRPRDGSTSVVNKDKGRIVDVSF